MSEDNERTHLSEAERQATTGAETAAEPGSDEVGPISGDGLEGDAVVAQPGADDLSDAEKRVIAEEREERLDPANRPDLAEVDNSGREFDETKAMFSDAEEYDEADQRFPPSAEQGV